MRHRLVYFAVLFTCALTWPVFSAWPKPADGLELSLALGIGNHRPDLEDKFFNDRFFGAVFVGGFGFNTDWEDRGFLNLLPSATYRRGRWSFEVDVSDIESRPAYLGYTAASSLTVLDAVDYDGILRRHRSVLAGYALNPNARNHFFQALGGLGRISVESESTVLRAVAIGISTSALGVSTGNRTEGRGIGILAGIGYRYILSEKLEFAARWMLGALNGTWESREAFAFTFPSIGFRIEDGDYSIRLSQLRMGVEYAYSPKITFFAQFEIVSAIHGDSEVSLLTDTAVSDPTTYLRDAVLTYSGSSQSENASILRLGARYRLEL